jgi:hypothetical protein
LKKETLENILGQWKYAGQVLLKIRKSRKYSWPSHWLRICARVSYFLRYLSSIFPLAKNTF